MGHTWVLGQRFLNEFRFNYAQQHQYQSPSGVDYYKQFDFSPARFVGTSAFYNFPSFSYGNDNFFLHHAMIREWRDDFSISLPNHNIKLGADIQNLPMREDAQGNPSGTWNFVNDQVFDANNLAALRGPINNFTASFPGLIRYQPHHYYQMYAQDEWKVGNGLTLNLGIRYDLDTRIWNEDRKNDGTFYPRVLPFVNFQNRGDKNNISPRLGLELWRHLRVLPVPCERCHPADRLAGESLPAGQLIGTQSRSRGYRMVRIRRRSRAIGHGELAHVIRIVGVADAGRWHD